MARNKASFAARRQLTVAGTVAALATTFLTLSDAPVAAQDVHLSNIASGIGGFVINGQAAGDYSGRSVSSAGDVNGDGLADVIVGANYSDPAVGNLAGRSYVVFGKSSGFDVDLSAIDNGIGGFAINGQAAFDESGQSVSSAGDVNGDGLADVIVGAARSNPAGGGDAGRSYVVFGKTDGADVDLSAIDAGTGGFVINGQAADDWSGFSVSSAGDVNGDGLADVIVGAPYSDPSASSAAGRSYVVFGKTNTSDVNLSAIDGAGPSGVGGFVINGQMSFESSGWSVSSAGDVNGDGLADVIVGARLSYPASGVGAGRSYVVFGKTNTSDVNLSAIDGAGPSGVGGFVINGQAALDVSGTSVSSAGDVNGDGLADVIVGAPASDPAAGINAGRSYVVFGKSDTNDVNLSAIDGIGPSGVGGFVINGQAAYDNSGTSVASAGDVNGDGLADLLVGAPFSDTPAGDNTGRSYVVFGKTNTIEVNLSAIDGTGPSGVGGFVINGQVASDRSGRSVSSAGDVNGDGLADVIVGAPYSDPSAGSLAGRSYVVFSPLTPSAIGSYRGVVVAGNPDRQAVGSHRFGDDDTIFPDSRAWVDFDAGTLGTATVTLTRNDNAIVGFNASQLANVQWQVATTRTGFANCVVTLRYTDAEITGLTESQLGLFSAATAAGPFTPVTGLKLNPSRNEIAGTVAALPRVFVIADITAPTATVYRLDQSPTSADIVDFLVQFSEPVAPTFTAADIMRNGTLSATSTILEVIAADPAYVVRVAAGPPGADGTLGITVGNAVTDTAGVAKTVLSVSPLYDIDRGVPINCGLAGDVDKNGVVNVADVTLLSNFIVNGAPPLP